MLTTKTLGLWRLLAAIALTPVLMAAECGQGDDDSADDDVTLPDDDDDTTAGDDDSTPDDDDSGDDDSAGGCPDCDVDGDGWSPDGGDCDDTDPTVGPQGLPNASNDMQPFSELCDGLDTDCDGQVPAEEEDNDVDGHRGCNGDCNDNNPEVNPAQEEIPANGWDDDCEGTVDDGEFDGDGDGAAAVVGGNPFDCDDSDITVFPGAPEISDGQDNNCDGLIPPDERDDDGDGFAEYEGDCDDGHAAAFPGNPEVCDGLDNECDGQVDDGFDLDGDGFSTCGAECDDNDAAVYPGAPEGCDGIDTDCNGLVPADEQDSDGDGFAECAGDCSPSVPFIYPGAPEGCDGIDTDCNGTPLPIEADADADGYRICQGDCDDSEPGTYPGAVEQCNGSDDSCDGNVPAEEGDIDGDGAENCADTDDDNDGTPDPLDCGPMDATTYPGAAEVADDGIDQNCSGEDAVTCLADSDTDGFGSLTLIVSPDADCSDAGEATSNGDCDDTDATVYPGAPEQCNGLDDNCDTIVVAQEYNDGDGDGFVPCAGDCDDNDGDNFPGNQEVCDQYDNNCDSNIDEGFDSDGDGFTAFTECDDADATRFPGAPEACNGLDDNCDGNTPAAEADADSDDYRGCQGDCNDSVPGIHPGALEQCNNVDDNCNGSVPAAEGDNDGDGIATCAGDCNDSDPDNFPGNVEACDGQDNNCDGLTDEGLIGSGAACPGTECDEILADQPTATDGVYWIDPDAGGPFQATCEMNTDGGGWTVIDPALSQDWSVFFSSWTEWVPGVAAGPSVDPSHTSWRGWLDGLADSETEFRRSPDCDQVVPADGGPEALWETYRMVGQTYGCYSVYPDPQDTAHTAPADWVYPEDNCSAGWYNSGPSLGLNGTLCVAFRGLATP